MQVSLIKEAPFFVKPVRSTPVAVEVRLETIVGPGSLDIAWRVPASLATIPLDIVVVLPLAFLFRALGAGD